MKRRIKALLAVIAVLLLIAGSALIIYFTRPAVAFITSGLFPPGYDVPMPDGSFFHYRRVSSVSNADLVITAPDASVPDGIDSYLLGRLPEDGENVLGTLLVDEGKLWAYLLGRLPEDGENVLGTLLVDEGKLWETALDDTFIAVLYEESSVASKNIVSYLKTVDSSVKEVKYQGRVSSANLDAVKSEIGDAETILCLTPSSSMSFIRDASDCVIVVDALDAAAMETSDVDKAVSIDWDSTISNLLSGNAELSYCLISL